MDVSRLGAVDGSLTRAFSKATTEDSSSCVGTALGKMAAVVGCLEAFFSIASGSFKAVGVPVTDVFDSVAEAREVFKDGGEEIELLFGMGRSTSFRALPLRFLAAAGFALRFCTGLAKEGVEVASSKRKVCLPSCMISRWCNWILSGSSLPLTTRNRDRAMFRRVTYHERRRK